jgi:hypothetical protein
VKHSSCLQHIIDLLQSRNRSGQATLNEVDTLIENASRLRLEAAYEPAQIEERFAPPQLTMRRGLVHSQYAPSIASSQNVAGGQQPLPAYNPYSSGFHAPLSGHMPLGGSYAPSHDFGPPSSAGGIEINRAISPMENSPAGSLHSPPTPMPRAQVKQWPAQALRAQPDSSGTQKLHSILHFHASQSHSNVLQGHPDSVSTPEQRLAYSKNVMPNSMQHKRMIQDLVDKLLEDPPAPDTKYYIVYQMPRPSTTQKYPNKGGKVTSAKVGQLPDMWLCLSAFSAFGFSDGCHEKANCVYREGWFSVQEEVIIAYHAPKWLDEARIAWQANKVNGQITHHTKVWPYAPEPCQYDDRFGATISSQPQEKSGANKETSGENKVNTGQKGLLGPHSNPTPLSKPNPLSTGGPATEDAAQTLLRKLRRE